MFMHITLTGARGDDPGIDERATLNLTPPKWGVANCGVLNPFAISSPGSLLANVYIRGIY